MVNRTTNWSTPSNGVAVNRPSESGRANLYRGMFDWLLGIVPNDALSLRNTLQLMLGFARQSPNLLPLLIPGQTSETSYREFCNRIDVFRWFATADSVLRFRRHADVQLSTTLQRIEALTPFHGLWTTEGIGYYWTTFALQNNASPNALLSGCSQNDLPNKCLLPLHTGMGLAFASHLVTRLTGRSSRLEVRTILRQFIQLCRDNARSGYTDASLEAIGLVCQILRPRLVQTIHRELIEIDPLLVPNFWHGCGRGLYFSPASVFPCSNAVWPSLRRAMSEPPDKSARMNAVAGFAWAVALVNIRDPLILEALLKRHGRELCGCDAFANGVSSAAAVWDDWSPDSRYLADMCRHLPTAKSELANDWNQHARSYCDGDLPSRHVNVKQSNKLEGLFQYQSAASGDTRSEIR